VKWPVILSFILSAAWSDSTQPSVSEIIQRSIEANKSDWAAAPGYGYFETDRRGRSTRTYEVLMLLGSPYQRLVAINGRQLSSEGQEEEQQKLKEAMANRQNESARERAQRIAQYERDRKRDHLLMEELAKGFDFKLLGEEHVSTHDVFALQATPRAGYQPPNSEAQVLTGMQGELWIDRNTFQWVKVEAEVMHPVSIEGFVARVEPGTRFEFERMPVAPGVWLPKHFTMKSRSKILLLFTYKTQEDETYFDYHKSVPVQTTGESRMSIKQVACDPSVVRCGWKMAHADPPSSIRENKSLPIKSNDNAEGISADRDHFLRARYDCLLASTSRRPMVPEIQTSCSLLRRDEPAMPGVADARLGRPIANTPMKVGDAHRRWTSHGLRHGLLTISLGSDVLSLRLRDSATTEPKLWH